MYLVEGLPDASPSLLDTSPSLLDASPSLLDASPSLLDGCLGYPDKPEVLQALTAVA